MDNVWYFLVGRHNHLSIDINATRARYVGHLKDAIKAKIGFLPPAFSLTLDRVAIDKSLHHETSINELKRLSENLQECMRLDDMAELSVIFGEILPAGKVYIILPWVSPYIVEALSKDVVRWLILAQNF
jgi:hypothetical protein